MPRGIPGSGNSAKYSLLLDANVKGTNKIKALGNSMQGVQGRAKNLAASFKGLLGPLAGIAAAVGGVQLLRKSFDVLAEREADFRVLTNALERISTDAPAASKALRAMADELGYETLFDEKAFQKGFALLTSFKNIALDSYGRVAETAADLAQINQTDLKSSFLQLAKALSDPTKGLTALSRSGVIFTETQREMILELHNAGREMEAQAAILKIVEESYKGAARSAAEGLAGAFDTLGQRVRDFNEALGTAASPFMEPLVEGTSELFGVVTDGLNAISDDMVVFAKNIETALAPLFKWILAQIQQFLKLLDELFSRWRNLKQIEIKEGDKYESTRNKLFRDSHSGAVSQAKERAGVYTMDDMPKNFPRLSLLGKQKPWKHLYDEEREKVFNKLIEDYVKLELGLEPIKPKVEEINLSMEGQIEKLKGLKKGSEDAKNGLKNAFGSTMKRKLDDFKGSIKSVEESMAEVVIGGIKKMEDSLVDFVTTGKLSFKSLADSIIRDMARIAIQQAFTKPFTSWISNIWGGGKALGGSVIQGKSYLVGEKGPEIFSPRTSGSITPNNKVGSTSVVVNVDASGGSEVQGDEGQARLLGKVVATAVKNQIANERRPGGLLYA